MDVDAIISGLEKLNRAQLARVEATLRPRLQGLGAGAPASEAGESQSRSPTSWSTVRTPTATSSLKSGATGARTAR